ncbi:hypothetical protein EON62_06625, partial [archaeon]
MSKSAAQPAVGGAAPVLLQSTASASKAARATSVQEAVAASRSALPPVPESVLHAVAHSKPRMSVVTIGHVDAGKSTLMGHLLFDLGTVSARQLHQFARESKAMGKASFAFAWVMDADATERERGVTIDVGVNHFETDKCSFTLLDAPGHRDFVPNTITAIAQADVAILVIDASPGEYEMSIAGGGQAREHAQLARNFGITQLIVAVNKMDGPLVNWSEGVFNSVVGLVSPILASIGFKKENVTFVPVSGLTGVNLVHPPAYWLDSSAAATGISSESPAPPDADTKSIHSAGMGASRAPRMEELNELLEDMGFAVPPPPPALAAQASNSSSAGVP